VEHRKLRTIRPLMLMPKGTIYFSEINSDEANLYTNSIKSPIGKKAYNSEYFPVSVIQEAPRDSGPPVQMSCFALMVWTRGSMNHRSSSSSYTTVYSELASPSSLLAIFRNCIINLKKPCRHRRDPTVGNAQAGSPELVGGSWEFPL
jgi:hypothetical protein